jgi:hypothetical protein
MTADTREEAKCEFCHHKVDPKWNNRSYYIQCKRFFQQEMCYECYSEFYHYCAWCDKPFHGEYELDKCDEYSEWSLDIHDEEDVCYNCFKRDVFPTLEQNKKQCTLSN